MALGVTVEMSEQDKLTLITLTVRQEVLKNWNADSCIASTRILGEVLRYFGYTSEPLPVALCVFNKAGFERMEAGDHDVPNWPQEAWSVGIEGSGVSSMKGERRSWDGHLVALVNDGAWLIDPSLDQLSRPHRGLSLTPVVLSAVEWDDYKHAYGWLNDDTGTVMIYQAMPEPGNWRSSRDWVGYKSEIREAVAAAIRALKPVLASAA